MKYKDWLNEWLNDYVHLDAKERTIKRYSDIIRLHIVPALGEMETSELTVDAIQKFIVGLLKDGNKKNGCGLAPNTVNTIINVIQGSLKVAEYLGHIDGGISNKIKRPKVREKAVECFTFPEQKSIENYIMSSNKDKLYGIILCLYTGIRIGELLALNWDDIDFSNGLMTIEKSCHDGKDEQGNYIKVIEEPKTESSNRIIPIPKQILQLLRTLKQRSRSNYLVADSSKIISVRSYQRSFDLLQRHLGIPHRGFHALRHTFATRAVECGMDIRTLSEVLGHKSPTVTLKRYTHSLIEHKRDMMNKIGKLL